MAQPSQDVFRFSLVLDTIMQVAVCKQQGGSLSNKVSSVNRRQDGCEGCASAGANAMALSLAKGKRVTLSKVDAFADGVAVKQASRAPLVVLLL